MNHIRLTVLAALLAVPHLASAYNPDLNKCCECITVSVGGQILSNKPGDDPVPAAEEANGDFTLNNLDVKVKGIPGCENVVITSVKLHPKGREDTSCDEDVTGQTNATLPAFKIKMSKTNDWEIVVKCSLPYPCVYPIKVGGCDENCTASCQLTGSPSASNGCFSLKIPIGASHAGDSKGVLRVFTPTFANPGIAGIGTFVPSTAIVTRDTTNLVTKVVGPVTTIDIVSTGTERDPNAFTIFHKRGGVTFRTTIVSLVDEGGKTYLRADSTFVDANGSTTFRFQQSKTSTPATGTTPAVDTYCLESGPFKNNVFTCMRRETLTTSTFVAESQIPTGGGGGGGGDGNGDGVTPDPTPTPTPTQPDIQIHRETVEENNACVSDIETTWENHVGGWEKIKQVIAPTTDNKLTSTWTYYQPGEVSGGTYGGLKLYTRYDGYTEYHTYLFNGGNDIYLTQLPFAGALNGLTLKRVWNSSANTLTTTRTVNGKTLSQETETFDTATATVTTVTYTSGADSGNTLTSSTRFMPGGKNSSGNDNDFGGQPASISNPDGTTTSYTYQRYEDGGKTVAMTTLGPDSIGKSTTTTYNRYGNIVRQITSTEGYSPDVAIDHFAVTAVDVLGRPTETFHFPSNSSVDDQFKISEKASAIDPKWTTTATYSCCGISSSTDRHGVVTTYEHDGLRRQTKATTLGVTTETVYDGLTTTTKRNGLEVAKSVRNLAGTETATYSPDPSSTNNGDLVGTSTNTTYTLSRNEVGDLTNAVTTTTTTFAESTQITTAYPDGRPASSTGNLQPEMTYSYGVNDIGLFTTSAYLDGATAKESTTTQTDWTGRTTNVTKGTESINYAYNSSGQLESVTDADNVRTLYAYNSIGERTTTALKLSGGDVIDYGTDQITRTETLPTLRTGGTAVLRTSTQVWKDQATAGDGTCVSYTDRTPDGLSSWAWRIGVGETSINTPVGQSRTEITTQADGTRSRSNYTNNLLTSAEQCDATDALIYSISYGGFDASNRPQTSTDSRTGTTTTAYVSDTVDLVASVIPPAGVSQKTIYAYDSRGNRTQVDAPDTKTASGADLLNVTNTLYDSHGRVESVTGDQVYPVSYTYDYAGRMKTMTTTGSAGNATTTWNYYATTGRLQSKLDNSSNGPSYTYTNAGRLAARKWARGSVTEYFYQNGLLGTVYYSSATGWAAYEQALAAWQAMVDVPGNHTAGEIAAAATARDAAYAVRTDLAMPAVTYNYNAFASDNNHIPGTLETVTRAGVVWTYKYDPSTLRLLSETQPVSGTQVARILTRSSDSQGRPRGFILGTDSDTDSDHTVSYDYNNLGRLNEVTGAGKTFDYGYTYALTPSPVARKGDPQGALPDVMPYTLVGPKHSVTLTYEATRNALVTTENKVDTSTISAYSYSVNSLGQRGTVVTTGIAFDNVDRGWVWGYDSLGQLTNAANNTSDTSLNRAYAFDTIGNRTSATEGATTVSYTPTDLNQYSAVGSFAPEHDLDGNMTKGPTLPLGASSPVAFGLEWDAENRLVAVRNASEVLIAAYVYDPFGRRIRKTTTTAATQGATDTAYVYDGWNVVAEYTLTTGSNASVSAALLQTYTWGLDLSGSLQGAGGVGGLLCIHRSPVWTNGNLTWNNVFYPTYDGNGNVSEFLDKDGVNVAHFEHDPFGRVVSTTGTPDNFTFRFSTKPLDMETGLYYYGYRYMDPLTGRWPSRDPIEEKGGENLYGFGDNSINGVDVLGGWWISGDRLGASVKVNTIATDGKGGIKVVIGNDTKDKDKKCCLDCITKHEQSHKDDALQQNPNIGRDATGKSLPVDMVVNFSSNTENYTSEIKAHTVEKKCLEDSLSTAKSDCKRWIQTRISAETTLIQQYTDALNKLNK
jgi:RHS repeat-associated protein